MARPSQVFLIAIGLVFAVSVVGAERLRAHYELNVQEGADLKRIEMASDVTPGTPIEYDLGVYRLSMSIDVGSSGAYVLTVSLAPLATPNELLVKRSFNGTIVGSNVGPLEFEVEQGSVKVSGAMALSSLTH